ncbi:MAG: heme o synthase [Cytophagaceae bacterium]|nr:heme o synthase [Cytophagaceae bacterium]MDW8455624.1 heme o synthase [Cytophagaceae bacterium]
MITDNSNIELSLTGRIRAYAKLMKPRLTFLVMFSSTVGFMLATTHRINIIDFILFNLAGFLVTTSSNAINQIIEVDIDKLMKRTAKRPLPLGAISQQEAKLFAFFSGAFGILLMYTCFNLNASLLCLLSLVLYAFVYTPLKTRHPIAVFVGAIPGALPPMIGWVAVNNKFGWEPGILFAIQFVWQFPHFWAIAWVLDDDYKKAGIRLLPGSGKDIKTAFQIMIYTLLLIPLGCVPNMIGMAGKTSMIIAIVCGTLFLAQTFYLMKECSNKAARQIMFGSFLYLPIVQIAFVLDKL